MIETIVIAGAATAAIWLSNCNPTKYM